MLNTNHTSAARLLAQARAAAAAMNKARFETHGVHRRGGATGANSLGIELLHKRASASSSRQTSAPQHQEGEVVRGDARPSGSSTKHGGARRGRGTGGRGASRGQGRGRGPERVQPAPGVSPRQRPSGEDSDASDADSRMRRAQEAAAWRNRGPKIQSQHASAGSGGVDEVPFAEPRQPRPRTALERKAAALGPPMSQHNSRQAHQQLQPPPLPPQQQQLQQQPTRQQPQLQSQQQQQQQQQPSGSVVFF